MGPVKAALYPGNRLVRDESAGPGLGDEHRPKGRATYQREYDYRGSEYVYGAFVPHSGEALTACYPGRCTIHWLDFLERTESWLPAACERVVGIVDNLGTHRSLDVLLFMQAFPRWHFLFIPKRAAYLNLIEAWWKVLRSLSLKGRRFENFDEVRIAIQEATNYWNEHRHPFVWGRRRRHQPRRRPGIASVPGIPGFRGERLAV